MPKSAIHIRDRAGVLVFVGVDMKNPEYIGVIAHASFQSVLGSGLVAVWRLGSKSETPKAVVTGKVWLAGTSRIHS